jgi:anthranilate synthase component 2
MLLMIDNYDSFTFNLVQYFGELAEVRCCATTRSTSRASRRSSPSAGAPGPCSAEAGTCVERPGLHRQLPILGGLGPQAIGAALGGKIVRAKTQMHGKTDVITTDERGVYLGLPRQFTVIRYHSLVIEQATRPKELEITATSQDGEIMGVRHAALAGTKTPMEGVQFHPESILTEHGHAMLRNFLRQSEAH